ncbi:MAG: hypothetical protein ACYDA4_06265 [Ignavibacteriaceae bacterium]
MKTIITREILIDNMLRKLLSFFAIIFAVVLLSGCEKSSPTGPNGSPAIVEGKVVGSSASMGKMQKSSSTQSGVQGATVILAMVKADGSLQTVSNAAVQTDASGKFDVETNLNGISNLVVVATQGASQWKAVITSQVQSGLKVYAEPLDNQTTIKTDIFIKAKEDNDGNVTYAEIENYISSGIAAEIETDTTMENNVEACINAEANAEATAASNSSIGMTQGQWQSVISGDADAEASLERNLYYANNQSDDDAAKGSYFQGIFNAYINAGLSGGTCVKLLEISQRVFINSLASLNTQVAFTFEQRSEEVKAIVTNYAVQSSFSELGASQSQMSDAITAGTNLAVSINNALTMSDIDNDYETYRSAIEADMSVILGMNSTMMTNMDANLSGYRATLEAAVSSNVSLGVIVNAYSAFYSSVKTEMSAVMGTTNGTHFNAASETMMILYANF